MTSALRPREPTPWKFLPAWARLFHKTYTLHKTLRTLYGWYDIFSRRQKGAWKCDGTNSQLSHSTVMTRITWMKNRSQFLRTGDSISLSVHQTLENLYWESNQEKYVWVHYKTRRREIWVTNAIVFGADGAFSDCEIATKNSTCSLHEELVHFIHKIGLYILTHEKFFTFDFLAYVSYFFLLP